MKIGDALNVIAMLERLLTHDILLMFAGLAAGAAGRHVLGDRAC